MAMSPENEYSKLKASLGVYECLLTHYRKHPSQRAFNEMQNAYMVFDDCRLNFITCDTVGLHHSAFHVDLDQAELDL